MAKTAREKIDNACTHGRQREVDCERGLDAHSARRIFGYIDARTLKNHIGIFACLTEIRLRCGHSGSSCS